MVMKCRMCVNCQQSNPFVCVAVWELFWVAVFITFSASTLQKVHRLNSAWIKLTRVERYSTLEKTCSRNSFLAVVHTHYL
jgi:hypothetical protein